KFIDAWYGRGFAYGKLGRHDEAVADYTQAIELDPEFAPAWCSRGHAHAALKQWDKAIADQTQAIQLKPNWTFACGSLAWLLATCPEARLRNPGRAVELAQRAAQLAPDDGGVNQTLGVALYRADDARAAVAALEKSMKQSQGGDAFDWLFLAMAHHKLGGRDE